MKIGYKMILDGNGQATSQGMTYVLFENTVSEDYQDITSVVNFVNVGWILGKDYKWIRKQLQSYDWSTLTSEERICVAKYKASTEENCKSVLSESDYVKWMSDFDLRSQECRVIRMAQTKSILFANIDLASRYGILGTLNTIPTLTDNYIHQGIEGTTEGDPVEGLFNFVESTVGGSFENIGIATRSLTMSGTLTQAQMVEAMMQCLRHGNY